jgi:hypothetical protein
MRRDDVVTPGQICNRPRDLQDTVESPRGELKLLHRRAHQRLTRRVELAQDANVGRSLRVSALHTTREA